MAVDSKVTNAVNSAVPANTADAGTIHTLISDYKEGIRLAAAVEHSVAVGSEPYLLQHLPGKVGVAKIDNTTNIGLLTVSNVNGDTAACVTGAIAFDTTHQCMVAFNGTDWVCITPRVPYSTTVAGDIALAAGVETTIDSISLSSLVVGELVHINFSPRLNYETRTRYLTWKCKVDGTSLDHAVLYDDQQIGGAMFWEFTATATSHTVLITATIDTAGGATTFKNYSCGVVIYPKGVA